LRIDKLPIMFQLKLLQILSRKLLKFFFQEYFSSNKNIPTRIKDTVDAARINIEFIRGVLKFLSNSYIKIEDPIAKNAITSNDKILVGNPGSPTTPPENLFISKNINLILFLLIYL